ncbi:MAG: antibiotic biosynthesis monooxygenase [Lentisphaeria bacterium]|jgi:quinol monooxygenase YgiN|nr:antibiotic biosynthesis monooxygenase [Lentisphaeria bacterium]
MIYVIARMELYENCKDAMQEILAKTVPQVLSEDGCIMYTPCWDHDAQDGRFLTIVEAWTSLDMQQAHLAAPHMVEYREAVKDLRKGCDVQILDPAL